MRRPVLCVWAECHFRPRAPHEYLYHLYLQELNIVGYYQVLKDYTRAKDYLSIVYLNLHGCGESCYSTLHLTNLLTRSRFPKHKTFPNNTSLPCL